MKRSLIIGVGGAHSGVGKTAYASMLFKRLNGWGAIKYTKTSLYSAIVDDLNILMTEGKDTRRFLDSGAEKVLWVQSPLSEVSETVQIAVERLSDLKGIVVEGNSAIEFLKPDIIIFIFGDDPAIIKDSAEQVLNKADIVVCEGKLLMGIPAYARLFRKSPAENEKFLDYMAGIVETKEKIRGILVSRAIDGRLPCALARRVAEELGVSYREVGDAADELDIKITDCELGCF